MCFFSNRNCQERCEQFGQEMIRFGIGVGCGLAVGFLGYDAEDQLINKHEKGRFFLTALVISLAAVLGYFASSHLLKYVCPTNRERSDSARISLISGMT